MYTPRFSVCIRTPDTLTGWTLHSDHTADTDALTEAATLRNAGHQRTLSTGPAPTLTAPSSTRVIRHERHEGLRML